MLRSLAASSVLAALLVVAGCSSESSGDPNAGEVASAGTGICGSAASWKDACTSAPSACDETIVGTCSDVTSLLNASILDGAKSCLDEDGCDVSPTKCLAKSVASAKKTEAHKNLAKAFCGCLLTGESACVGAIDDDDGPAKAALAIAVPLSDDLANAIAESCTTTPGCAATFSACAQGVVTKKIAETLSAEAAGCVAKSILSAAKDAANGKGGDSSSDPSCTPKTCEDYDGECGTHDNGCGGTVSCGECASSCAARTCEQLGKTCGTHADGCGGTVNCGLCPSTGCAADAKEPNDTKNGAVDLGAATDAPNTTKTVTSLTASDGDEDWFKLRVTDSGFGGNPRIDANTNNTDLEVTVFHVCDSLPNYSSCTDKGAQDNTVGFGCRGTGGKSSLSTDCKGIDETGTTFVRVRKLASDGKCSAYNLTVEVY